MFGAHFETQLTSFGIIFLVSFTFGFRRALLYFELELRFDRLFETEITDPNEVCFLLGRNWLVHALEDLRLPGVHLHFALLVVLIVQILFIKMF